MTYQKKSTTVAEESEQQLSNFKAVDAALDLGEGCNLETIQVRIDELRQKIKTYNEALALIDSIKLEVETLEKELKQLMQKARLGVAFKYGKESEQFKLIGGTPPSEAARKAALTRAKGKADEDSNEQD
jgi:hypothetical protein